MTAQTVVLLLWGIFSVSHQESAVVAFRTLSTPIIHPSAPLRWSRNVKAATALQAVPLWLPNCAASDVTRVAAVAGCAGLVSQFALTKILRKTKLREIAAYTAHTIVAMALMLLVSGIGVVGWWGCCNTLTPPVTPYARLLEPVASARWLAAVIVGMFSLWDVPVSIAVPQLRKSDVILHHIAMTIVAWVGAVNLPMHYLFFYLGISELSSLPLLCYDQLTVMCSKESTNTANGRLTTLRDRFQVLAAISFTLIRAYYFTKITVFHFVPDVRFVLPTTSRAVNSLRFGIIASIGFTALQLYWFSKIVRVIVFGESKGGGDQNGDDGEDVLGELAV